MIQQTVYCVPNEFAVIMLMDEFCQMGIKFFKCHAPLQFIIGQYPQRFSDRGDILSLRLVSFLYFSVFYWIFLRHVVFFLLPQKYTFLLNKSASLYFISKNANYLLFNI